MVQCTLHSVCTHALTQGRTKLKSITDEHGHSAKQSNIQNQLKHIDEVCLVNVFFLEIMILKMFQVYRLCVFIWHLL